MGKFFQVWAPHVTDSVSIVLQFKLGSLSSRSGGRVYNSLVYLSTIENISADKIIIFQDFCKKEEWKI